MNTERHFLRRWAARWVWHLRLAAGVCAVAGCVDASIATRSLELDASARLLGALVGAGVGALLGVFVGTLQTAAVLLGGALAKRAGLDRRWAEATDRDAEARGPVVAFHARLFTLLLLGTAGVLAFGAFYLESGRIKEEALRDVLVVLAAAGALVTTLLGNALLQPLVEPWVARLDRRVRLPFPRFRWLRFTLFELVPVLALAVPLFAVFGVKLGVVSRVLGVALYLVLAHGAALSVRRIARALRDRVRTLLRAAVDVAFAVLAVAATLILQLDDGAAYLAVRGGVVPLGLGALQTLSDVDRDGVSSLFGGRDCAAFDAKRSPGNRELPGNRIDDDCNGKDADVTEGVRVPTFAERLPKERVRDYNVLLYIVDSLRADHLPMYGYAKNTSPVLQALSKEAWLFERAYSQSSNTSLSVPSLMTGKWPSSMSWKRGVYPLASGRETYLPELLLKDGYLTALVLNQWVAAKLPGIQHGFEHKLLSPPDVNWKSGDYAWSNAVEAMRLAKEAGKPFFVTVHIDDVHHPYVAHRGRAVPAFENESKELSAYDKGIAVFDQALGMAIAHLKNQELWEDTILIVTADHGEEFLEHGGTIHSRTCYIESVHVPLIVRVPGFEAERVPARVALVDLMPSLLELLGRERFAKEMDGQSLLFPVLAPKQVDPDRPIFCSIFQMLGGRQNFFISSVRNQRYALMHELLSDGVELYDTRADPEEKQDLSADATHAGELAELKALLQRAQGGNLFQARSFQ